jgi:hypothetical protein
MACSTDANEKPKSKTIPEKVGEVTPIETVYEEGAFDTPVYSALLKELELCSDRKECLQCATCTPEFFRFFEIAGKDRLEDVFAIQIKALTKLEKEPPLPTREVRVYSREAGSLVRCNRIRGYVIERITSKSGVDDLLIRIRRFVQEEDEEYFFHCLFKWSDKDRKYIYRSVERIETRTGGGDVKEEFKAETSQQVYNELVENGFIL